MGVLPILSAVVVGRATNVRDLTGCEHASTSSCLCIRPSGENNDASGQCGVRCLTQHVQPLVLPYPSFLLPTQPSYFVLQTLSERDVLHLPVAVWPWTIKPCVRQSRRAAGRYGRAVPTAHCHGQWSGVTDADVLSLLQLQSYADRRGRRGRQGRRDSHGMCFHSYSLSLSLSPRMQDTSSAICQ